MTHNSIRSESEGAIIPESISIGSVSSLLNKASKNTIPSMPNNTKL